MEFGIPKKLARLIKMCLTETYSRVREGKYLSEMFPIRNGLKQGDALSPLLFNFALEYAINPLKAELNPICHLLALLGAHLILHISRIRVKRVQVNQDGLKLNGTHWLLAYADDVNIQRTYCKGKCGSFSNCC